MSPHRSRSHVFACVLLLVSWWAYATAPTTVHAAASAQQSQDAATHPVVMQQAANEVATAKVGPPQPFRKAGTLPLAPAPSTNAPVGGGSTNILSREVFGFALFSSLADPNIGYPSWNFDLLSTVAVFGLDVNWDGHLITTDSGYAVWNSSQMTALMSTARQHDGTACQ